MLNEPFTGFYKRLRDFVSSVGVNDEEEKDMILHVCDTFLDGEGESSFENYLNNNP